MAEYFKSDAVTFPSLVMKQIGIIQAITSKELRDGTRAFITPIGEQVYENEDTRYSFLQAVETLGSLLSPYFDKDTTTEFDDFEATYDLELVEALKDDEFLSDLKKRFGYETEKISDKIKSDSKLKTDLLIIFLNEKCKIARKLYRRLIQCFKDNDFLSSESFNEGVGGEDGTEADGDDETPMAEINEGA